MAYDPHATPLAVPRRYPRERWNDDNTDVLAETVGDPYHRHYPGQVETVTNAELAERARYYRCGLSNVGFHSVREVTEGPCVTTARETTGYTANRRHPSTASIEISRVEDGHITGVWNGHTAGGERAWNVLWDRSVNDGDVVAVERRAREWGSLHRGASGGV